jgi:cytidylate kinase
MRRFWRAIMKFEELNLAPAILQAVQEQGYDTPTPVQAQAIPIVLAGHDLLAGAQTGTGKTAAFMLPILQHLTTGPLRKTRALIIAVDGPAASGKGTIAARLAQAWGLPHLDTGLLYRAVGLGVLDSGGSLDDSAAAEAVAQALDAGHLNDIERLTDRGAGEAASRVAGYPGVSAALLDFQRAFAARPGGAVLDGRDIGTIIAPDAMAKLFITATPEVRAMRRWKQLTGRGDVIAYEDMLADIMRRDERDAGRGAAPMVQAKDAVLLDTTDMDIETAFDAARRIVEAARVLHGL